MRGTVLDALIRHSLIGKLSAVSTCVTFLAHANAVAAISVVVTVVGALLPSAIRPSVAFITSAHSSKASTVATASSLAYAETVRGLGARRASTADRLSLIVDCSILADSVSRAVAAARIRERPIGCVDPLVTSETSEFLVTNTFAQLLRADTVSRAVVRAGVDVRRAVGALPLEVAITGAVVADTVVRAVVRAIRHGAVISIPSLEA
jgi:hypothetical protein